MSDQDTNIPSVDQLEEWRPIPGHPYYEVSSIGNVRSLFFKGKPRAIPRILTKINVAPNRNNPKLKYPTVSVILQNGKCRRLGVHRLVTLAFHGLPPFTKAHAAHKDGNGLNNLKDNLYWATAKENIHDMIRHGTIAKGEHNGSSKLTDDKVRAIRSECIPKDKRLGYKALSFKYGVDEKVIRGIHLRLRWRHVQ